MDTTNVIIRSYQPSDYPDLVKLLQETNLYIPSIDTREHLNRKIAHDVNSILVAFSGELLVGTVFTLDDNGWVAFIFHLAVAKAYQHRGIGRQLMRTAEAKLKEKQGYQVHLLIDTDNLGVVDFYKKVGFKESNLYRWMEKDIE